jgi:hypothetical protein
MLDRPAGNVMQDYQNELALIGETLRRHAGGMSVTEIAQEFRQEQKYRWPLPRYPAHHRPGRDAGHRDGKSLHPLAEDPALRHAQLFEGTDLVVDEECRIVDVNENFLTLLNLSREKTMRKNLAHIQIPDVGVCELLETSTKDDDIPSRSGGRKGANAYSPGNLSRPSSTTAAGGSPAMGSYPSARNTVPLKGGVTENPVPEGSHDEGGMDGLRAESISRAAERRAFARRTRGKNPSGIVSG